MAQIGPLIVKAVSEKSMGHFDPLIGRDVVWMVFIHTAFSFWCGSRRPAPESKARFDPLIYKSGVMIFYKSGSGRSDHH
jgi:hypothetical protein